MRHAARPDPRAEEPARKRCRLWLRAELVAGGALIAAFLLHVAGYLLGFSGEVPDWLALAVLGAPSIAVARHERAKERVSSLERDRGIRSCSRRAAPS